MILTLAAGSLRSLLLPASKSGKPSLSILDLPVFTRDELGLRGLTLSTDLLVGADKRKLELLRERADKAGCACLVLVEPTTLTFPDKPSPAADAAAKAAVERMGRVIQAAQLLGCSSAAFSVSGIATEAQRDATAKRFKLALERAEKLDINVLVGPAQSSPAIEPEHVTDLLKRIGGFRIGTYPDFQVASTTKDPIAYLRRLSPYASAVCAATLAFEAGKPIQLPPPAKRPPKDDDEDANPMASLLKAVASAGKSSPTQPPAKGKGKGILAQTPPPPPPPEEEEDDEDLDDDQLEQELESMFGDAGDNADDDAPPEPLPSHPAWDLFGMVMAVSSVGYDGALAVDFRGTGDVTLGVKTSRRVLQAALEYAAQG
jgi:hypothetical protein